MIILEELQIDIPTQKDIHKIYKIEQENFKNCWSEEYFLFNLALPSDICKFYIAKFADIIVGYVVCHISDKTAHILNLSVKKEYQNFGVGSKLLEFLFSVLLNQKVEIVMLEVRVSNVKAINFYKKFGFFETKIISGFYPDKEDALVMIKKL